MRRGRPYEIAIIGMGCRFAGRIRPERVFREHRERQGLHAGGPARPLERQRLLRPRLRRPAIASPRAGAATSIRRSRSTRPRTESCRGPSKGASPSSSWCSTRPWPRSRMRG